MTTERIIEFSIDGFVTKDEIWVGGRCYRGPILTGDEFTKAFMYETDEPFTEPRRSNEREILLKVVQIETYGRPVDELSEGLSGQLLVSGLGVAALRVGEVISS